MARIRLVQRRKMINAARGKAEERVVAALRPIFKQQHKRLERFLRRANLRKRLIKIKAPANGKATILMKEFVPQEPGADDWDAWKGALVAAIILALIAQVTGLGDIENLVWVSQGYAPLTYLPGDVVADYQRRIGRNLDDLATDTMAAVEREITEWYISGDPFPALMSRLDRWFDDNRITTIAETEISNLVSQMVLQAMISYGWGEWYWDALGEIPCTDTQVIQGVSYGGCLELHGKTFKIGDPMPPDASHPRCHCLPTPVTK